MVFYSVTEIIGLNSLKILFRQAPGAALSEKSQLRSWAVTDTASRGSHSNTVPDLEKADELRIQKVAVEVRRSLSDNRTAIFHPELDVKQLMTNIRRFHDRADEWPFPVGQSAALRNVY